MKFEIATGEPLFYEYKSGKLKKLIDKKISNWYKEQGHKDLPWRLDITPYRVWISELILQQTQVNTGINYFLQFISKYPTLDSIKNASEDDILALWKGLGYYRRANYIFQAKEIIFKSFNGIFPENFDDLIELRCSQSTAGVLSILLQQALSHS